MKKTHIVYIIILVVIAGSIWALVSKKTLNFGGTATPNALIDPSGLYTNSTYRFTAKLPVGYSVREMSASATSGGGSDTILFENNSGDGIQILVTPYTEAKDITKEIIKKDIPDMKIMDEQVVEVGLNHKGLAFKSDNQSFDGDSREVWFVFRGNLYQISTYARLDSTLKSIFATWQFL